MNKNEKETKQPIITEMSEKDAKIILEDIKREEKLTLKRNLRKK